jgi:hypothetical protein
VELTEEQARRIGMEFRRLTQGDALDTAVKCLQAQYHNQIVTSAYEDTDTRENAFKQSRALDDLMVTINTFIAIAESEETEVPVDADNIF